VRPARGVGGGGWVRPYDGSLAGGVCGEPRGGVGRARGGGRVGAGKAVRGLGSGMWGLRHSALARALGGGRIIATDVHPYRLEAARRFGADVVLHATEDVPARLREVNDGRLADVVFVCAGAMSAFQQSLRSVERGGTIQFFAPTPPGAELPIPVNDFWRNSITVMTSYGAAPYDLTVALDLIRARRVPVAEMITHRLGLAETGLGFRLVAEAKESIKVIVEPQR